MPEVILPPAHPALISICRLLGERFSADLVIVSGADHTTLAAHHWPVIRPLQVPKSLSSADMLILTDATHDGRVQELETQLGFAVGFYAASGLKGPDGHLLGHLYLIGRSPRMFERQHHQTFLDGLCVASDYLEQRRVALRLARIEAELLPYRSGVETLADAVLGVNGEGCIIYASRAAETLFGQPAARLEGQLLSHYLPNGLDALPELAPDRWTAGHAEGRRGEEVLKLDVAGRRNQGDPSGVTLLIRDVSAQEHTLASLSASQIQIEALLRAIPDALLVLSSDGVVLSQKAGAALPDGEAVVGRSVYEVWPIDVAEQMMLYVQMVQRGDAVVRTFSFRTRGERPQQIEARLVPMDRRQALMVLRSHTLDQVLETTAQRYLALLEASADGVALLDHHQQLWYVNPELVRRLGRDDQHVLLGRHWSVLFPEDDRSTVVPAIKAALDHRDHWNGQVDVLAGGGVLRQEIALSAFEDHNMVLVMHNLENLAREGREPEGDELLNSVHRSQP